MLATVLELEFPQETGLDNTYQGLGVWVSLGLMQEETNVMPLEFDESRLKVEAAHIPYEVSAFCREGRRSKQGTTMGAQRAL